jgi:hypothetical protein
MMLVAFPHVAMEIPPPFGMIASLQWALRRVIHGVEVWHDANYDDQKGRCRVGRRAPSAPTKQQPEDEADRLVRFLTYHAGPMLRSHAWGMKGWIPSHKP